MKISRSMLVLIVMSFFRYGIHLSIFLKQVHILQKQKL